jgi:hypothetical protein
MLDGLLSLCHHGQVHRLGPQCSESLVTPFHLPLKILNRVGADENGFHDTGPAESSGLISKIDVNDKNRYEGCSKKNSAV